MERPEIKVTAREYQPGQAMRADDATRPTLLVEEVELVIAALTAQGKSADWIKSFFEEPDIKCLLPGQSGNGEVQK